MRELIERKRKKEKKRERGKERERKEGREKGRKAGRQAVFFVRFQNTSTMKLLYLLH